ncbi:PspA/IM30 family protein [Paenibacillus sp. JSM ZJ436]|uniref:PspA/IM30 family protein n=1 Tax=Paenibacillus sp. JSM ZJ436 TaxID=3376190 RepID=UPI0037AB097C
MGILSRFTQLMSSSFPSVMEQAEDPERAVRRYLEELGRNLGQLKAEAAAAEAAQGRARRALDEAREELHRLERYAAKAQESGDEGKARSFQDMKEQQEKKVEPLQADLLAATEEAARLQELRGKLVADVRDLEARHARVKHTMAEARLQQQNQGGSDPAGPIDAPLGMLEEKADLALYEAEALAELRSERQEKSFDELFDELIRQAP